MRQLSMLLVLIVMAQEARAEQILVLPGPYTDKWSSEKLAQKANLVRDRAREVVKGLGHHAMADDSFAKLAVAQDGTKIGDCPDVECVAACLEQAARQSKADNAIAVYVDEKGSFYNVAVVTSRGKTLTAMLGGSFAKFLDGASALIKDALLTSSAARVQESSQGEANNLPSAAQAQPQSHGEGRKRLSPALFWIGLSLTAGAGVGWAISNGVAHSRRQDLETKDWSSTSDWQEAKSDASTAQSAARVLFGCTAALGLATGIVAVLTDFSPKKPAENSSALVSVAPSATGALFVAQGSF